MWSSECWEGWSPCEWRLVWNWHNFIISRTSNRKSLDSWFPQSRIPSSSRPPPSILILDDAKGRFGLRSAEFPPLWYATHPQPQFHYYITREPPGEEYSRRDKSHTGSSIPISTPAITNLMVKTQSGKAWNWRRESARARRSVGMECGRGSSTTTVIPTPASIQIRAREDAPGLINSNLYFIPLQLKRIDETN